MTALRAPRMGDINPSRRHKNIVYHGMLPAEKWQDLLQESKFMIGLGECGGCRIARPLGVGCCHYYTVVICLWCRYVPAGNSGTVAETSNIEATTGCSHMCQPIPQAL